jgi:predicted membrane protein
VSLPAGRVTHVRVDQVVGQVVIWLPDNSTTQLSGHVSFGDIEFDGQRADDGGTDVRTHKTLTTGDGSRRLDLSLDLSAGQIRVHDDNAHSTTNSGDN